MAVQTGVLLRRAGRIWWRNGLTAKDHRHTDFFTHTRRAMLLAQPVAQLGQQGVMGGLGQIIDINQMGQPFATRCTRRDKNYSGPQGPIGHAGLGSHLITGIDDGVHAWGQQLGPIVVLDKFLNGMNLAVRVECMNAVSHGENFGLANGGVFGLYLSVDVGFANVVQVNECQLANATARQCLGRPGPHATDTDHSHMGAADTVRASLAVQASQAAKAAVFAQANRSTRQTW